MAKALENPFRPGAGHMPPYLAGRTREQEEFRKLLAQDVVLQNVVLTGLRGVGKTVLLDTFKPEATRRGWVWVGTDLSESASVDEESLARRIITDLAVITAGITVEHVEVRSIGFRPERSRLPVRLDFNTLWSVYSNTPGLVSDKLKAVLDLVWAAVPSTGKQGIVFAYDEAQNMADHAEREQYPLSLLLDVFQSVQKKNIRFMLVLTGLPTLFPKLVAARTYSERMFRVISLERLAKKDSRDAVTKPVADGPLVFTPRSVDVIVEMSGGYPYFIQFICREVYDAWIQQVGKSKEASVPVDEIQQKLDSDFFAGRWARVTDRQRELLTVIAKLDSAESEFAVLEIVEKSKELLAKPFGASHVNQMLNTLSESGLIYKNRHGRYSLAVPLLNRFILRQLETDKTLWG
ncbi:MAG: AAA family ATPase [Phycisphaerales bacterium]|nr:AAA family ATPase [Phycisphaerales bacterium]